MRTFSRISFFLGLFWVIAAVNYFYHYPVPFIIGLISLSRILNHEPWSFTHMAAICWVFLSLYLSIEFTVCFSNKFRLKQKSKLIFVSISGLAFLLFLTGTQLIVLFFLELLVLPILIGFDKFLDINLGDCYRSFLLAIGLFCIALSCLLKILDWRKER